VVRDSVDVMRLPESKTKIKLESICDDSLQTYVQCSQKYIAEGPQERQSHIVQDIKRFHYSLSKEDQEAAEAGMVLFYNKHCKDLDAQPSV
jgi:hypothetical protein